jgi:hypothetical protein
VSPRVSVKWAGEDRAGSVVATVLCKLVDRTGAQGQRLRPGKKEKRGCEEVG